MIAPILPFALIALLPLPLLGLGALWGGIWVWLGLAYVSVFAFGVDEAVGWTTTPADPDQPLPGADALSVVLALGHFTLLAMAVAGLAGATGLGGAERVGLFLGAGLYIGQVSVANAHELIHRTQRGLFGLGKWVFISMLYGHVTSSHRLLHHAHVATPEDPNFPPSGTSFYRYLPRSMWGNLTRGFAVEQARARRSGRRNPYIDYALGAAAFLALAGLGFGWAGVGALVGLGLYAQVQHALVDYLQHYGLQRRKLANGRYEPQGPQHSWNSPHWFTSMMAVNVTRHSDHHAHPGRKYPALQLDDAMPRLPYSLPAMGVIALIPPLWFRMMDRRVARVLADG